MNISEVNALNNKELSHIARSLYTFYLRPNAEQHHNVIDLNSITTYLFSYSKAFPTTPNFDVACMCLKELEVHNLICRVDKTSPWQGSIITLPLFVQEDEVLPSPPFAMHSSWRPQANFYQACLLVGLDDCSFTEQDLKAFTSFWSGKHEQRNQIAWERAFATRLLKGHLQKAPKKAKDPEEKEVVQNNEQLTTAQLSEKAQQELADIFK